MANGNYQWNFSTVGGVKRVNLDSGSDLAHLASLDQKLWTALSCPVDDLEIDKKTLQLIDADGNGQIRVPEILAAVQWVVEILKDPGYLIDAEGPFALAAINEETEAGAILLRSAQEILRNLGREDDGYISAEDTGDVQRIFAGSRFNGDGVITEDSAADAAEKQLIAEIISVMGPVPDRGGKPGVSAATLTAFLAAAAVYLDWFALKDKNPKEIMPIGEATPEAFAAWEAVREKIDDYFLRTRLAAYEPQTTQVLNLQLSAIEAVTTQNLTAHLNDIAACPMSRIEPGGVLNISTGINPAWEPQIAAFRSAIVAKLMPQSTAITDEDWARICKVCSGYGAWMAAQQGGVVAPIGADRLHEIVASDLPDRLVNLLEQDMALAREAENMMLVDKLVRYHRDLYKLLKNFVTFNDFYTPGTKAIFQAGTLYIEQRSCDLCIRVSDMAKHASVASFSGMFLVYCECRSRASTAKMTIVAALTNGDTDNLVVGRNALFYDRQGQDWDATIVKIIDNPISIRQAFFSPYRKLSRFIETQVNKVASAQDSKVSDNMTKGVESAPGKVEEQKAKKEPQTPFDVGKFVGIFAAIGLALGAIGSAIASVIAGFMKLEAWKIPFALGGLLLLISGPAMVMAYLKLRKRNLAPLLDANGWAINAMVAVNIQFGNMLTHLAELPHGARLNINDPFSKKQKPLLPIILLVFVVLGMVLFLLWKYKVVHFRF